MAEERRGSAEIRLSRATRWRMWFESDCAWFGGSLDGAQVGVVENRRTDIHHIRAGHQRGASEQEALGGGAFESQSCWAEQYTSLKIPTCRVPVVGVGFARECTEVYFRMWDLDW